MKNIIMGALKIEELYGTPQDIEGAVVFMQGAKRATFLQTRDQIGIKDQAMVEKEAGFAQSADVHLRSTSDDPRLMDNELKGGIDFTSDTIPLNAKGQAIDFAMPADITVESLMDAPGLVPIIINITPVTNFYLLLGLEKEEEDKSFQLSQQR